MSGFSRSSFGSSSASSHGPSTPYSSSSRRLPSDSSYSSSSSTDTTPPGSLREYSASLKASHTMGMAQAMKSMPLERGPRSCDATANPFDALFTSPSPSPMPRPALHERNTREEYMQVDQEVDGEGYEYEYEEGEYEGDDYQEDDCEGEEAEGSAGRRRRMSVDDTYDPRFRPSLINFHRQNSDNATPGSVSSESSFEGGKSEDYRRMYGPGIHSPSDLAMFARNRDVQTPPAISQSTSEIPTPTQSQPYSPYDPAERSSVFSTLSSATMTSISSTDTITSLPSPTLAAQIGVAGTGRMSRPSLLRPRPRPRPYEMEGARPAAGSRMHSFGQDEEEMRQDGRSVSEVMVAMAGLRCQRGRGSRV
ncbi:uncharacterized protein MKK02DRAFT_39192 [Dioszegia hungarica]|uniref:Uncharacterized protein n=1 Tax=Dioszegia hungarica TaxID=4972 RepID=A0AA38H1Y7_9TREE|nr:uncharacterized protein MKK02DRAFT_39192 [Dioszegia hungarica]KAI9633212.1 hypothetical protein MKK02DRAFT_39192 [Dioszegia hungarica]